MVVYTFTSGTESHETTATLTLWGEERAIKLRYSIWKDGSVSRVADTSTYYISRTSKRGVAKRHRLSLYSTPITTTPRRGVSGSLVDSEGRTWYYYISEFRWGRVLDIYEWE